MDKNIHKLFSAYLQNSCTEEEIKKLMEYFGVEENETLLRLKIREELAVNNEMNDAVNRITARADQRIFNEINRHKQPKEIKKIQKNTLYIRIASSAAALLLVGFLWLQWNNETNNKTVLDKSYAHKNDVLPGSNTAQLILSDGKAVELGQVDASLHEADGTNILGKDGALVYNNVNNDKHTELLMNTLLVPKAGIYHLTLPDGTQVWLNSASSITFPTKFASNVRKVEVTGEVYFEVAHNKNAPFEVTVQGKLIKVLGTHFNVRAYNEVKTTLFEGSVEISNTTNSRVLSPGEEALVKDNDIGIYLANVSKVSAWRNGRFHFADESIESILQEVSRWYDVDIDLSKVKNRKRFSGTIKRKLKLTEVLNVLNILTGYDFKLQNKKVSII